MRRWRRRVREVRGEQAMLGTNLTRDDWRALLMGTLPATLGALGAGLVTWGIEEGKRRTAEAREKAKRAADESEAWRKNLTG